MFEKMSKLAFIESLRICVSLYVNGKLPHIDIIGAQMQTGYYMFVQNFFQILYDDT